MRPRLEAFLTPPYLSVFLIKLPPSFARSLEGALYIASVLVWETFCCFPRFIWCRVAVFSPFSVPRPHLFSFFPYLYFFPIPSISCLRLCPISTARIGIRKRRPSFIVFVCSALCNRPMAPMNSAMRNAMISTHFSQHVT